MHPYDEKDFNGRERFTDPEILRSSLAGVILCMKSLHLGIVEDFETRSDRAAARIADGYQLLNELGAVDDANELTPLGTELSRLPLDPRVGRMLLEALVAEVLTTRCVGDCLCAERAGSYATAPPMEAQQQADTAQKI